METLNIFGMNGWQWLGAVLLAGFLARITSKFLIPVLTFLLMKLNHIDMDFEDSTVIISVAVGADEKPTRVQAVLLECILSSVHREAKAHGITKIQIIQKER